MWLKQGSGTTFFKLSCATDVKHANTSWVKSLLIGLRGIEWSISKTGESPVADPDFHMRGSGLKKIFCRPFGPHFGLKIRGGGRAPGPLPWIRHWSPKTNRVLIFRHFLAFRIYLSLRISDSLEYGSSWKLYRSSKSWKFWYSYWSLK